MQVQMSSEKGIELGNNGITLYVKDPNNGPFRGKLRLGRGTVEWCSGRTRVGNGVQVEWNELIGWFESDE